MIRIYKYELQLTDVQKLLMPQGAVIIKVGEQKKMQEDKMYGGQSVQPVLCAWAVVDDQLEPMPHSVRVLGTGHPIDQNDVLAYDYFDTTIMSDGFVWHVFFDKDAHTVHRERLAK